MKKIFIFVLMVFLFLNQTFSWDLYMGGDIMLSRNVGAKIKSDGFDWVLGDFNPIKNLSGSLLLFNLESPFSNPDKDKLERTFSFGANEKNVKILNDLKGENNDLILTLANNHILNSSYAGLELTINTLDLNHIFYVGVSKNERIAYKMFSKNGKIYCINGYTYDGKKYVNKKTKDKWFVNNISESFDDLKKMKKDECDYKVMMFHWGTEYRKSPTKKMKDQAHKLIDNGLDLLVGSHTHIFGDIENYKDKYIFYSLGNYIFDQNWGEDKCQKNMDCVFDNQISKKAVPTYIGTGIFYNIIENYYKIQHFKIDNGKLTKFDNLIGLVKYFLL